MNKVHATTANRTQMLNVACIINQRLVSNDLVTLSLSLSQVDNAFVTLRPLAASFPQCFLCLCPSISVQIFHRPNYPYNPNSDLKCQANPLELAYQNKIKFRINKKWNQIQETVSKMWDTCSLGDPGCLRIIVMLRSGGSLE